MMRRIAAVVIALHLTACAAGGAIDYLHREYGSAQQDGSVDIGEPGNEQVYRIWLHRTKPRINVQTSLGTAAGVGFMRGLTFGTADAAPVQPMFERAATKFLAERYGPGCRVSNPTKIANVVWEFDYACAVR
jgi:hypothetical protein